MKVEYDEEADAAYIKFSTKRPGGAVEIQEGVLHTTLNNEIVGIEILDVSKKIPVKSLYNLELSLLAA